MRWFCPAARLQIVRPCTRRCLSLLYCVLIMEVSKPVHHPLFEFPNVCLGTAPKPIFENLRSGKQGLATHQPPIPLNFPSTPCIPLPYRSPRGFRTDPAANSRIYWSDGYGCNHNPSSAKSIPDPQRQLLLLRLILATLQPHQLGITPSYNRQKLWIG